MTIKPHISVLQRETLELLCHNPQGLYCDGTTGAGGHSLALLQTLPKARLICIDQDQAALDLTEQCFKKEGVLERATLIHGQFSKLETIRNDLSLPLFDGIMLDLGLSSMQIDMNDRGFSFLNEGPLDMRMDTTQRLTALSWIKQNNVDTIAHTLKTWGEEKYHKKIAAAIKSALIQQTLTTTTDLANIITNTVPIQHQRRQKIHPATRTFQAIRIAINDELGQLSQFLSFFPKQLMPQGRCAIISFHSLEDRLVKQSFRDLEYISTLPKQLAIEAGEPIEPSCLRVTKKPITPSDLEKQDNPRSRSAKLRVCERFKSTKTL